MSHTITHATHSTHTILPGRRAITSLWTILIMVLLCFVMIATASCSLDMGNTTTTTTNTTTNTNTHTDSHNCNGALNCLNISFNIPITINVPYLTTSGTAVCGAPGNLWVNGSPASPTTNPKQDVIVVYKGSGGTISAGYTPPGGKCNQFPVSVAPSAIASAINILKAECQSMHICPDGYYLRQYNT